MIGVKKLQDFSKAMIGPVLYLRSYCAVDRPVQHDDQPAVGG